MRILVLLSVVVLLAGLYFVVGLRRPGPGEHAVSAAAEAPANRFRLDAEPETRLTLEALATRVEALAVEVARLRGELERNQSGAAQGVPAAVLDDEEFRHAYRDTIVRIIAEDRQRPSAGDRAGLLRGSVQRYLISHGLDSDAHADEWERVLEGALARVDALRTSALPAGSSAPGAQARQAEWQREWTALRAETFARLATNLEARHVDVLLDMVFNF